MTQPVGGYETLRLPFACGHVELLPSDLVIRSSSFQKYQTLKSFKGKGTRELNLGGESQRAVLEPLAAPLPCSHSEWRRDGVPVGGQLCECVNGRM